MTANSSVNRFVAVCAIASGIGMSASVAHRLATRQNANPSSVQRSTPVDGIGKAGLGTTNRLSIGTHTELVAVLLTSSTCSGSRNPDFLPLVQKMKIGLRRRATRDSARLVTVAAIFDDSLPMAIDFLGRN